MESSFDLQLRSLPAAVADTGPHQMAFTQVCNTRNCPSVSGATCYQTCYPDTCQSPPTVC